MQISNGSCLIASENVQNTRRIPETCLLSTSDRKYTGHDDRCALHKNQWYPIREVKRVDLPTSASALSKCSDGTIKIVPSELHSSLNEVNKFSETTITVGAKAYDRFIEL